jgi:hypothetical protein
MNWLVLSIVLSVVLTVVLNLAVRAFPGAPRRLEERLQADSPRMRVFFPWRAMLIASVVLTVLVNVLMR